VDVDAPMFPRPVWFHGAKLNFAENLLFPTTPVDEDSVAVIVATETGREKWTWRDLRERVRVFAAALSEKVKAGDRVVGKSCCGEELSGAKVRRVCRKPRRSSRCNAGDHFSGRNLVRRKVCSLAF